MAMTVSPLTTTVLASAGQQYSGTASGINNAVSRIAGVLAIAVIGALALSVFQHRLTQETATLNISASAKQFLRQESKKLGETSIPKKLPAQLQNQIQIAINRSFIHTYKLIMLICAGLAGTSALFAFFWIKNPER